MRAARALVVAALAALLLAGGAGCRFDEPVEIPLLFQHEPGEERVEDTLPFLFTDFESIPQRDEERAHVLWPFVHYVREGREKVVSVLGVQAYRDRIDHRGFRDVDMILGPVLYGHSADEGSYFAFLPFGGTTRGLVGKDLGVWVLFPLFFYGREKDWKSWHFLWPIVNVWSGGGRSGFRVFPLFAHYEREGAGGRLAYRRTWALWPFWQTLENNLDSAAGAQRMWFLFPFFGRSEGPETRSWMLLFPLFKYYENTGGKLGGPLYDVWAPWPFVHVVRGRDRRTSDFWPFFGMRERGYDVVAGPLRDTYRRRFILWPLWRDEEQANGDTRYARWWLMPFVWSFETEDLLARRTKSEFKVWPLFRYKKWEDGRTAVNIISPLWFQDPEGAFERIWGPLTRVYHAWRDEDGSRRTELLWGVYGEREYVSPEGEDVSKSSVLFGMFELERRAGRSELRLFWLPFGPSWGEGEEPERAEPDRDRPGRGGQRTPG
jgi:hypothetical protein